MKTSQRRTLVVWILATTCACRDVLGISDGKLSPGSSPTSAPAASELVASRQKVDYGDVESATLSRIETVELRTSGSEPFLIRSLDLPTNVQALDLPCANELEAKTSCVIQLQFSAAALGAFHGVVTVHTDIGSIALDVTANVFWSLEIETTGDEAGLIECLDGSCACGGRCTIKATMPAIRMRARAEGEGFFTTWGGACTGALGCSAEISGSHFVTATFRKPWTHAYDGPGGQSDSAAAVRTSGANIFVIGSASIGTRHGVSYFKYGGDGRVYWEMPDLKPANEAASDSFGLAMGIVGGPLSGILVVIGAHGSGSTFLDSMLLAQAPGNRQRVFVSGGEPRMRGVSRSASVYFGELGERGWAQVRGVFDWLAPLDEGRSSIRSGANLRDNAIYLGGTRSMADGAEAPTLRKLDDAGEELWKFRFETERAGAVVGMDASRERIVVCGHEATREGEHLWVASVAADGTLQWEYRDGAPTGQSAARSLVLAPNGDVLVAGFVQLENANVVPRLTRLTANGALIWKRDLAPMPLADARDHMQSVDVDAEGSVVVVGRSPARGGDAWIRKYFQPQQFVAPPVAASDERKGFGTLE